MDPTGSLNVTSQMKLGNKYWNWTFGIGIGGIY